MRKFNFILVLMLILLGCESNRDKATKKFSEGQSMYNSSKYDTLIVLFQEAVKLDTSFSMAKYLLAKSYIGQENYEGAINTLNSIKNAQVANDSIYLQFAIAYGRKRDWDKSIEYADKIISINPNSFEGHLLKGTCLHNKAVQSTNDLTLYKNALENIPIANKIKPNNSKCLEMRGIIRFGIKDYEGAIKDLSLVINQEKNDSSIIGGSYRFIGLSKFLQGKLKEAISNFDTALTYLPDDGLIFYCRGLVKTELKMNTEACDDFRRAMELGEMKAVDEIQLYCKD